MKNLNMTFETFEQFRKFSQPFGNLYLEAKNVDSYQNQSKTFTKLFLSDFYRELSESNIQSKFDFDFGAVIDKNTTNIQVKIKENLELFKVIGDVTKSLSCFMTNRVRGVDSEELIIEAAANGSLLAGIVLMNGETENLTTLDSHVQYKIRMDVDKVPMSSSLKEKLWVPGPDADMYYNMRYFWGFIQIQDMLDTAIMQAHGIVDNIGVYLQQFPYPCFRRDNYNSGLYTTQLLQVALIFGYALVVALSVRDFLWERESKNIQMMRIMGMKYTSILTSYFLFLFLIVLLNSFLLTLILCLGGMLPHSNPLIIFFVLTTFGVANIMFIFLLTLVLKKSSSGSVAAFLIYIVTFLPFIIIIAMKEQLPTIVKVMTNFLMSTSFGYCFLYITRYEQRGEGIHWSNYMVSPMDDDDLNCFLCHLIMILDICVYFLIAYVVGKFASLDGTVKMKHSQKRRHYDHACTESIRGIQIFGLKKYFKIDRKHKRLAVNLEELQFPENSITGLLGHNGAGKSTTMALIAGMDEPSEGVININTGSSEHVIGFCPQHNILFDNLTVKEHLLFYASVKNKDIDLSSEVEDMMKRMKITDKADTLSKHLSEGLRRRLSIGIAFIGNSKIAILDEPTSGVDPNARQDIWNLITSCKQGKTIIVSTHYIEEAELLCDKIVIMDKGRKIEEGTNLEIQNKYGKDLRLEIFTETNSNTEVTSINSSKTSGFKGIFDPEDSINKHIKSICPIVKPSSASHSKRTYSLPSRNPENFSEYQKLFAVLENEKDILNIKNFAVSSPSLEDIFLEIIERESIENIIFNTNKQNARKQKIFPSPDDNETLSDVLSPSPTPTNMSSNSNGSLLSLQNKSNKCNGMKLFSRQIIALLLKRFFNAYGDKKVILMMFILPLTLLILAMVTALIRPTTKTPVILLTPSMYGPTSTSFSSFNQSIQEEQLQSLFTSPGIGTTCMQNFTSLSDHLPCHFTRSNSNSSVPANKEMCSCNEKYKWSCENAKDPLYVWMSKENTTDEVYHLQDSVRPTDWILDSHFEFIEKRYGGWRFGVQSPKDDKIGTTKKNAVVYFNNKGFHSVAAYMNSLSNARLRASQTYQNRQKYGITAYSHPIKIKDNQIRGQSLEQHISDYSLSLLMAVVLTFLPATSIIYLIEERRTEQKVVQGTFGVGPITYWISVILWDLFTNLAFLSVAMLIIYAFQVRSFTANNNLQATFLLMFFFLLTSNSLIYLIEKLFTEPSLGQIIILTCFIFTSLTTSIIMLLATMFWWIASLRKAKEIFEVVFLLFPPYALSNIIYL